MPVSMSPTEDPLPVQPVLRGDADLLVLADGDLRISLSARHAVTVVGAPPGVLEWLAGFDGTVSLLQAVAAAPLDHGQARFLLAELDRAGLLADANHGMPFRREADYERDALTLAERARGPAPRPAPDRRHLVSVSGSSKWVAEVGAALDLAQLSVQAQPDAIADLHLIIGDVFDPAVEQAAAAAMAHGWRHLCVLVSAVDAALMPPTVPGRTACRRCWALHQDRTFTGRAASRAPARSPAAPHLPRHHKSLVIGLIVEHTLVALSRAGGSAGTRGSERYLDLRRGTVELRPIEPHPACGCVADAA